MKFSFVKKISEMSIEKIQKEIKFKNRASIIYFLVGFVFTVCGLSSLISGNQIVVMLGLPLFVGTGVLYMFLSLIYDLQARNLTVELRLRSLEGKL
ncbi:MAG: hypothetical protein WC325_12205 [Candidatus Bathyarchaeia archaeon]|jgi:hypothetical protein